jgi:hypothetical protein
MLQQGYLLPANLSLTFAPAITHFQEVSYNVRQLSVAPASRG